MTQVRSTIRGPLLSSKNPLPQQAEPSLSPNFLEKIKAQVSSLLDTEAWLDHGWTSYFYFTLLSELIKTLLAVLLLAIGLDITERLVENSEKIYMIKMMFTFIFGVGIILNLTYGIVKISKRYEGDKTYSEAQFSFLVTNLPVDENPDEIRKQFIREVRQFLKKKKIDGSVKEVILLQECEDYLILKNKHKKLKENIKETQNYAELTQIEQEMKIIEEQRSAYQKFTGQAILTLDTMQARNQMGRSLEVLSFKSFSLKINNQMPTFWSIQEPSQMKYKNIHKYFISRFILATILQLGISFGVLVAIYLKTKNETVTTKAQTVTVPYTGSQLELMALTLIPLKSFDFVKGLNNLVPYFAKESKYSSYLWHSLVNCFITIIASNYIIYEHAQQATLTSKIVIGLGAFLVYKIGNKILSMAFEKYWKKSTETNSGKFDFWSGYNQIYQLICIGICYLSLSPLTIAGLCIVSLVVITSMDRLFITKFGSNNKGQSYQIGFSMYFLAIFMLFCFTLTMNMTVIFPKEYKGQAQKYVSHGLMICQGVLAVLILGVRCYCNKGSSGEGEVRYEDVKRSFKSVYSEEYPFYHLADKNKNTEIRLAIL